MGFACNQERVNACYLLWKSVSDPFLKQCDIAPGELLIHGHVGIFRFPEDGTHQAAILCQRYHVSISCNDNAASRIAGAVTTRTIGFHHGPYLSRESGSSCVTPVCTGIIFGSLFYPHPEHFFGLHPVGSVKPLS